MMPESVPVARPFQLAYLDGRLGLAWVWREADRSFRRYRGELGLVNCWLRRTGGTPFAPWRPAANVHQALPLLSIASVTRASAHGGVLTGVDQLALALWRDGDRHGFLVRTHAVHRVNLSIGGDAVALYPDSDAPSNIPRARTFTQTLDTLTDQYATGPPRIPAQRTARIALS